MSRSMVRLHHGPFFLIALFLAVTYFSILDDYPPITADQTTYILLGSSIAQGRGYREVWSPAASPHTTYPPGYPFLLSWVIRARGFDPRLMRLMNFCFLALTLFFLYRFFKIRVEPLEASMLVLMAGIHTGIVWCVYHIFSESAFLFFSFAALLCVERFRRDDRVVSAYGLCAGMCACAAVMTRLAGIPLLAALGCYLVIEKPRERAWSVSLRQALFVLAPALAALVLWCRWNTLSGAPASLYLPAFGQHPWDYDLRVGMFEKAAHSLYAYLFYSLPHSAIGAVFTARTLFAVALTGVFVAGFARRVRRNRGILEYYTAFYLIVMLFWSGVAGSRRYLVPVIPLALFYFLEGIYVCARRISSETAARKVRLGAVVALVAMFLARLFFFIADPVNYREQTPAQSTAFLRAADWISRNTGQDDVILGIHPPDMYLYGGRKSLRFPLETLSRARMADFLKRNLRGKDAYLLISSVYDRYGGVQDHAYWLLGSGLADIEEKYRDNREVVYKLNEIGKI